MNELNDLSVDIVAGIDVNNSPVIIFEKDKELAGQVLGLAQWVRVTENPSQKEWKLAKELAEAICHVCESILE